MTTPERALTYWIAVREADGAPFVTEGTCEIAAFPDRHHAVLTAASWLGTRGAVRELDLGEIETLTERARRGEVAVFEMKDAARGPLAPILDRACDAYAALVLEQPEMLEALQAGISAAAGEPLAVDVALRFLKADLHTKLEQLASVGFTLVAASGAPTPIAHPSVSRRHSA